MLVTNLTTLIIDIQKHLILKPYDLAHDITHHYRVYEQSIRIADEEKLMINRDIVIICAWLHDLEGRKGEDLKETKKILRKNHLDVDIVKKIINIIKEHSLGKKQSILESKVLYDSDKLEYVNSFRLMNFIKAAQDEYIDVKKYHQYKKEWWKKIDEVGETLHFVYSKKKFFKMLPEAKKIMR